MRSMMMVEENALRQKITETFMQVIDEAGTTLRGELRDNTVLLESGLDSLGFAILVARLEEDLGWDPFTLSDEAVYPGTFGEFVTFYVKNQP